jgi:hypothetical protein
MLPSTEFSTFEILNISANLLILVMLLLLCIKGHNGDCQGTVISKIKLADGQCQTKEARMMINDRTSS